MSFGDKIHGSLSLRLFLDFLLQMIGQQVSFFPQLIDQPIDPFAEAAPCEVMVGAA